MELIIFVKLGITSLTNVQVNFNEDYKAVQYEVMAQQTIWE